MSKKDDIKEIKYQTAMCMARQMLNRGIIDEELYRAFDARMTEKYHPVLGGLFSDLSLIKAG